MIRHDGSGRTGPGLIALLAGLSTAAIGGVLLVHTANAVIAAATAAQAAAVIGALWFARRQLDEAAATRQDQARAYVVVYIDVREDLRGFPEIVVANFGATAAYNVTFSFDPPLRSSNDDTGFKLADVGMFAKGVPTLAPSMRLRTLFDHMRERPKDWETAYTATVTYRDREGRRHDDSFVLDLDAYAKTMWVDRKGLDAIHDEVELIRKELHNWRTGWGGPMEVVFEDRDTHIERKTAEREAAERRHEELLQERERQLRAVAAEDREADGEPETEGDDGVRE